MAKIKLYTAIIDHGDGSHGVRHFSSIESIIKHFDIPESEHCEVTEGGMAIDQYGSPIEFSIDIIDTDNFQNA